MQIKCTEAERGVVSRSILFLGKNKVVYTADDVDILAAHIVPLDVWYVISVGALAAGDEPAALSGRGLQERVV